MCRCSLLLLDDVFVSCVVICVVCVVMVYSCSSLLY